MAKWTPEQAAAARIKGLESRRNRTNFRRTAAQIATQALLNSNPSRHVSDRIDVQLSAVHQLILVEIARVGTQGGKSRLSELVKVQRGLLDSLRVVQGQSQESGQRSMSQVEPVRRPAPALPSAPMPAPVQVQGPMPADQEPEPDLI